MTALIRNGGRTVEIGFGIYIMFPVFYANVSECWNFPRSKRLEVNLGGLYFQALTLLVLCILNAWRPSVGLAFSIVWINLLVVRNLNPFLRMDGYWILADLLGQPSLHRNAAFELKRAFSCLLSRRGRDASPAIRIRPTLFLYCLATALVFTVVYYRFGKLILLGFIPRLPGRMHALIEAGAQLDSFRVISNVFPLLWQMVMIYVFISTLAGFGRQYLPWFKDCLRRGIEAALVR